MKRFGVCFKLEIVKNMVKAKGAGRFGCLANVRCADANGKVQSCSVAVLVSNLLVLHEIARVSIWFVIIMYLYSVLAGCYLYLSG